MLYTILELLVRLYGLISVPIKEIKFHDGSSHYICQESYNKLLKLLKKKTFKNSKYSNGIFKDKLYLISFKGIQLVGEAYRSLTIENAGGNSVYSEAISIQYFEKIWKARDIILEMEVSYWIKYKMVDYICSIQGNRIGVSVTRAMSYPEPSHFTYKDAVKLLRKKIYGLIVSRSSVVKSQRFYKSVLHIFCQTEQIAQFLHKAYISFDEEDFNLQVKSDIIVILTISSQPELYSNYIKYT